MKFFADNLPLSDLFLWTQRMSKLPNTQIMIFIWWKSEQSLSHPRLPIPKEEDTFAIPRAV